MARKAKKKTVHKGSVSSAPRKAQSRPVTALLLFTVAVLVFVAVWDFELSQSRMISTDAEPQKNLVGFLGAESSFWLFHVIGLATWVLPFYVIWIGIRFLLVQEKRKRIVTVIATVVSLLCAAGLLAMFEETGTVNAKGLFEHQLSKGVGGIVGSYIGNNLLLPVGAFGGFLILLVGFMTGTIVVFTDNLGKVFEAIVGIFKGVSSRRGNAKSELGKEKETARELARETRREEKKRMREARIAARLEKKKAKGGGKQDDEPAPVPDSGPDYIEAVGDAERRPTLLRQPPLPPPGMQKANEKLARKTGIPFPVSKSPFPHPVMDEPEPPVDSQEDKPKKPRLDPGMIKIISGEKVEKAVAEIPERKGNYVFPTIKLLSEPPVDQRGPAEDHRGTMEGLVRTLDEFGVKVLPDEIHTGPVVTRYEVRPAPGVRVEKIVNLDKNIALGLKAISVRILAPVPGKGTVGIEVPNKIPQEVRMREIIESRAWADSKAEIPVVLGKDVTGKPLVADLTKMPHVLIAGSTGSGKTVCINTVIASLLFRYGPEDLRFIMVDPKVVEMQGYNTLPHMLIPVVTEPKKVPGALKWLIAEMERRYQIFAKANVRNIAGFNAKLEKTAGENGKVAEMDAEMTPEERAAMANIEVPRDEDAFEVPKKKLPYIVCIIDELADLMMVAPADIETCIARLAQLARAAGIHLILATQRPSVNVITGVIKANLPSRISFKVASKVDSRTILDGGGAESLIGKGDMLFIPPGASTMQRAQGAFVSDEEIGRIVYFLEQKNDPPVYAKEVQQQIDSGGDDGMLGGGDEGGDDLLPDAIEVLRSTKRASTSMLQRRLRIGYNRAARLMEVLEDRGIVGPENGSSPREILVDLETL